MLVFFHLPLHSLFPIPWCQALKGSGHQVGDMHSSLQNNYGGLHQFEWATSSFAIWLDAWTHPSMPNCQCFAKIPVFYFEFDWKVPKVMFPSGQGCRMGTGHQVGPTSHGQKQDCTGWWPTVACKWATTSTTMCLWSLYLFHHGPFLLHERLLSLTAWWREVRMANSLFCLPLQGIIMFLSSSHWWVPFKIQPSDLESWSILERLWGSGTPAFWPYDQWSYPCNIESQILLILHGQRINQWMALPSMHVWKVGGYW